MAVLIPDDPRMDELARLALVCHLFDTGKITIGQAARLAELSELQLEEQLQRRGIPRYRYTDEMLEHDVEALNKLGRW